MDFPDTEIATIIPSKIVGPISIIFNGKKEKIYAPMSTFETPLWYSVKRGALVSLKTEGITVSVQDEGMSRSVLFYAENLTQALGCKTWIEQNINLLEKVVCSSSSHVHLRNLTTEVIGNQCFLRISIFTDSAAGHNMATKAADEIMAFVIANYPVRYGSISANICTDKKNSAINGLMGRGKRCTAEIVIPKDVCSDLLHTSPEKIIEINTKKNLLGSILAGSVRSANAHYANVLLAMYLATGQDAANIVEGSQGITFAELQSDNLYFSVNIPNIIVGTVGNGKDLDFVKKNLQVMECDLQGENSSCRLAAIICATVLCAELSLLAAQTNKGELMRAHIDLERN